VTPGVAVELLAALAAAELARGENALRLAGFDPALAVRCLLRLLESGAGDTGSLRAVLTGTGGG
jgi:methionyl-tRNA synthetase